MEERASVMGWQRVPGVPFRSLAPPPPLPPLSFLSFRSPPIRALSVSPLASIGPAVSPLFPSGPSLSVPSSPSNFPSACANERCRARSRVGRPWNLDGDGSSDLRGGRVSAKNANSSRERSDKMVVPPVRASAPSSRRCDALKTSGTGSLRRHCAAPRRRFKTYLRSGRRFARL